MSGKSGGRSNLGRAGGPEKVGEERFDSPVMADKSMTDSFFEEEEVGTGGRSGNEPEDSGESAGGGGAAALGGGAAALGRTVRKRSRSLSSKEPLEKGSLLSSSAIEKVDVE
jgi:hypothetical protein